MVRHVRFSYTFWCIAIFNFLISCNSVEIAEAYTDDNSVVQINVSEQDIVLNGLQNSFKIYSITHLETNSESVFGEPTKVIVFNNVLYVYSRGLQEILLFDLNGHFIKRLGKKGKGPDEYIDLRDFQIYDDNTISILTQNKIMYYDNDFNHIKSYDLGLHKNSRLYINPTQFHEENNLYFLWSGTVGFDHYSNLMPFLMYTSRNSDILNGYFPVTEKVISNIIFSGSKQNTIINPPFGDNNIYKIDGNRVYARYNINFGKNNLPDGIKRTPDLSVTNYCFDIHNALETDNYVYFQFVRSNAIYQGLYSKESHKCKIGKLIPITKVECTNDNIFIALIQPTILKNILPFLGKTNLDTSVQEKFSSLLFNIDENPLLCSFSIKPF